MELGLLRVLCHLPVPELPGIVFGAETLRMILPMTARV